MTQEIKKKVGRPFKPKEMHAKKQTITLTKAEIERIALIKKLQKFNLSKVVRRAIMEQPIEVGTAKDGA